MFDNFALHRLLKSQKKGSQSRSREWNRRKINGWSTYVSVRGGNCYVECYQELKRFFSISVSWERWLTNVLCASIIAVTLALCKNAGMLSLFLWREPIRKTARNKEPIKVHFESFENVKTSKTKPQIHLHLLPAHGTLYGFALGKWSVEVRLL